VDGQNYLGIYLSKESATVVCLDSQGRDRKVLGCFSVSLQEQEEPDISSDMAELARLIAEGCARRELVFSEVAVALDSAMFMQHNIRSEFKDPKQIAQTVRFDTEEALSADISDVALTFKMNSSDEGGSELTVFTSQKKILSDVLLSLQSNNIDPLTVEPDVYCLSRFISQKVSVPEDSSSLFGILGRRSGYFVGPAKSQQTPAVRTFLVGRTQDRTGLLGRQAPLVVALFGAQEPISSLKVFDSADSVNCQQLGQRLGMETDSVDFVGAATADPGVLADCADAVDFVVAYGAALAHWEKIQSANFRSDFMPYQGKKLRTQKTLKFLSVSVSVLLIALGVYITSQLLQWNKYHRRLRDKFKADYSAVMAGQKPPGSIKSGEKKLGTELRRTKDHIGPFSGSSEKNSMLAKLTMVLQAFNNNQCAKATKLSIDTIAITAKTIRIVGETSGRGATKRLRNEINNAGLEILSDRIETGGKGRDKFTVTVVPK
jgi:hypothetical protein